MKSLYDVLGARNDDDAQAIKRAFHAAVKAHHPDLHPGDSDAALRFRQIVAANAILRDEKQRAAYDHLLELERRQIKPKVDQHLFQVQYQRWQACLKMGGAAAIAVACALAGGYQLFIAMPTTAVIEVMKNKPPAARTATIVDTIKIDKVAASAAVSVAAAGTNEHVSEAVIMDTARDDAGGAPASTGLSTARQGAAGEAPAIPEEAQTAPHAAADAADTPRLTPSPSSPSSSSVVVDKGDDAAFANPMPTTPLPNDVNFYRELGAASYRAGDFPGAIANLDQAIRLDPTDARVYNIRGNAWDEIGAFENALADYDEAIRLDTKNPFYFHDRAIMWHRRGNLDKALVDLDRAIRFSFSDPNVYCDRGLIWYEKGSHARAIADFNRAIKLDPDFAAAYISRGLILHRNGEFNVAFPDLGRTIHVSPGVFDVTKRMASHP